eukprot:3659675-Pleurochrysis_carterae.AAC.2
MLTIQAGRRTDRPVCRQSEKRMENRASSLTLNVLGSSFSPCVGVAADGRRAAGIVFLAGCCAEYY